jgi:hypothetical protein
MKNRCGTIRAWRFSLLASDQKWVRINLPSQDFRPSEISRRERACASWQKSIATNCNQQLKPWSESAFNSRVFRAKLACSHTDLSRAREGDQKPIPD